MASKETIERVAHVILREKAKARAQYKQYAAGEKAKVETLLSSSNAIRDERVMMLRYCTPGTRFQTAEGPPVEQGVLLSVNDCSARVLMDDGTDTRFAPSVIVRTGVPKATPKPRVRSATPPSKAVETAVEPPKLARPKLLGYGCVRLIYWLAARGWDFEKVKLLFEAFEVPVSENTIWGVLGSWKNPAYFDPAVVTEEHAKLIERAVE